MLARGESKVVLICGAETFYPRSADAVRGEAALIQGIPEDYDADDALGSNELEQRHGLTLPIHGFPLFENAPWAKSGLEPLRSAKWDRCGRNSVRWQPRTRMAGQVKLFHLNELLPRRQTTGRSVFPT